MALVYDPQGNEIEALQRLTNWRGKRVLEVGCGDGRLTLRLAQLGAREIQAFDPDEIAITTARKNLPKRFAKRIEYSVGHAEHIEHPANTFEVVVFAWAL